MIPYDAITAWNGLVPWQTRDMVEQDLVLSRALVELFSQPLVRDTCTLRGGTALNKLVLNPPSRYSEDIDLVQEKAGPIGPLLDAIRGCLDPWLGRARFETNRRMNTLVWRFKSSAEPPVDLRLKVEINSREHGWVGRPILVPFTVANGWFSGSAEVATVALHDLMATKLRALYQRRKGRDLFDLHTVLDRHPDLELSAVISGFRRVMENEGRKLAWEELVENMELKVANRQFASDIPSLLPSGAFDVSSAWAALAPRLHAAWGPA